MARGAPAVRERAGAARFRRKTLVLRDGRAVTIRAVTPGDAAEIVQAFERLSSDSRYMRFMEHKKQLDAQFLARGIHPVAGSELTLVATTPAADGIDIVGAARYLAAQRPHTCEFAITVAEDWSQCGLATSLIRSLMRRAKRDGYRDMEGLVLRSNDAMLALARHLHFETLPVPGDPTVRTVRRAL